VALGVPGMLKPQIILMFSTTRVVGCQLYALGEIPDTHFQRLSQPSGHMVLSEGTMGKITRVVPAGIDPGTV
jgi:hypothetical protein